MSKQRRKQKTREPKQRVKDIYVARPFEGLPDEVEWVALRELVPAATAPLKLAEPFASRYAGREVTLATVLPLAWPAMTKPDGRVLVALQRQFQSGDVSRDIAASLIAALETEPGQTVAVPALPGEGPRLQDMLVDEPIDFTLHDTFEFWVDADATEDPQVKASLERADASIYPTKKVAAMPGAYWCDVTDRCHLRIVLPDTEPKALAALARLSADGGLRLGIDTKFAGMFRAHGVLVPVWDLPLGVEAEDCEEPVAGFAKRYAEALASEEPLDAAQRRARDGLIGRQLTLR
ncbi:DUF5926 family protein [Phytomonospora endophytica]|uniref:DUF5926 domain-containing protein n=1 Tax=Phytomonospora endophytica TaxID=714109 RepID=A0A841FGU0_9ACTN|nr:DUF5926 family protein [Phytomonospora endophytica]MBB6035084.1 hypothetical protein [Phytomonospora endophytica]GIG64167.1 preprotein translocase SecA [Phytomonospora endophytica]